MLDIAKRYKNEDDLIKKLRRPKPKNEDSNQQERKGAVHITALA